MSCLKKWRGKKESRTKSTENMSYSYRILLGPDVTGKKTTHKTKHSTQVPNHQPGAHERYCLHYPTRGANETLRPWRGQEPFPNRSSGASRYLLRACGGSEATL